MIDKKPAYAGFFEVYMIWIKRYNNRAYIRDWRFAYELP